MEEESMHHICPNLRLVYDLPIEYSRVSSDSSVSVFDD